MKTYKNPNLYLGKNLFSAVKNSENEAKCFSFLYLQNTV